MQIDVERLVADYSDLILRLSCTYLGSRQDAEDVCQNVLLKLITSQPTFSSKEHEKAWVIRVTANACKDLLKSAAWKRTVGLEGFDAAESAEEAAFAGETPIARAVQTLPTDQREAIYLFYYEGYPIADIARMTGKSPAAVAKQLSRARETLRTILERPNHG